MIGIIFGMLIGLAIPIFCPDVYKKIHTKVWEMMKNDNKDIKQ